ncbi:hypothetical protein MIMGU_mgv1a0129452mg, partial [Erythranthe guttata]
NGIMF